VGKRRLCLIAAAILAAGVGLGGRAAIYRTIPEAEAGIDAFGIEGEPEDPARLGMIRAAGERIAPLHRVKTKPKPGEWLDRHAESAQSFDAYRAASFNWPTARLTTLYVQPWGDLGAAQSRLAGQSAEMLARFYGVPVKTLAPVSLDSVPASARRRRPDWDAERIATSYILETLHRSRPQDAVAMLALTTADLSPGEGGRWVFGEASLFERVGVWSLFRQGDPVADEVTTLRRTLKTGLHETGHILSLPHCAAWECGMNGAGSRAEADSRPLWFCAECEKKVWWACKLDPMARYARLAEFAESQGLEPEAGFWRESLAALR
jgi:archaemetzincin